MSAEFPKQTPQPPAQNTATQEGLGTIPSQEDHDAHVTEFRNRESEERMKAHRERLKLEGEIEKLKESHTKALFNILNEVPEVAQSLQEIRPGDRQAALWADPGMLSANGFGHGIGNYDTHEGEKLLQYLARQPGKEGLREKENRIFALREAFFKKVEKLESGAK